MSNMISKSQLTAFQRWEMASFEEPRNTPPQKNPAGPAANPAIGATELDQIREAARLEAYSSGYKDGYEQGLEQGQQAGYAEGSEGLRADIHALQNLAGNFSRQLDSAGQQVRQDVFELALDLCEAMLKIKLELAPESILPIVQDAIEQLPSVHAPAQILLNPLDTALVKEMAGEALAEGGWRIVSDPHIERGGCKLETAQNLVDATVSTRWQRLLQVLRNSAQEDR